MPRHEPDVSLKISCAVQGVDALPVPRSQPGSFAPTHVTINVYVRAGAWAFSNVDVHGRRLKSDGRPGQVPVRVTYHLLNKLPDWLRKLAKAALDQPVPDLARLS